MMAAWRLVSRMCSTASLPSIVGILRSVIIRSIESGHNLKNCYGFQTIACRERIVTRRPYDLQNQLTNGVVIVHYKDHRHTP